MPLRGAEYIMGEHYPPPRLFAMEAPEATTTTIPLLAGDKKPMLLNVEDGVKQIITSLAKKEDIDGVDSEKIANLPNSITGVIIHFVVSGLKNEFNLTFDEPPVSLKQRGSALDKKVAGKKRLLTREQKNHIIEKMKMSFYENDIASGKINVEEAMTSIKAAFDEKREFEKMGYILPEAKTAYPHWLEEEETETKK